MLLAFVNCGVLWRYMKRRERMQELMTQEFTKIGFPSMRPGSRRQPRTS